MKVKGEIFLEFKDFQNSIKYFKKIKNLCDQKELFQEKIYCYEQLGILYKLINDHFNAIKYFRKQLELAWEQKDQKMEKLACDKLAIEYYYLGDLEKA